MNRLCWCRLFSIRNEVKSIKFILFFATRIGYGWNNCENSTQWFCLYCSECNPTTFRFKFSAYFIETNFSSHDYIILSFVCNSQYLINSLKCFIIAIHFHLKKQKQQQQQRWIIRVSIFVFHSSFLTLHFLLFLSISNVVFFRHSKLFASIFNANITRMPIYT